jgi:hypothetical protein
MKCANCGEDIAEKTYQIGDGEDVLYCCGSCFHFPENDWPTQDELEGSEDLFEDAT